MFILLSGFRGVLPTPTLLFLCVASLTIFSQFIFHFPVYMELWNGLKKGYTLQTFYFCPPTYWVMQEKNIIWKLFILSFPGLQVGQYLHSAIKNLEGKAWKKLLFAALSTSEVWGGGSWFYFNRKRFWVKKKHKSTYFIA